MGSYSENLVKRVAQVKSRGVHSSSAARYNNLGTSVARVANKVILGVEAPPTGIDKLDLFIYVPKPYVSINSRYTTTDAAYDVKKHIKEKGYHLLIDDRRRLSDIEGFDENKNVLVVARTVEHAKQCVQKLGVPSFIYYDYHLRGYDLDVKHEDSTLPFIEWLNEYVPEGGERVNVGDIPFDIISTHEDRRNIARLIHSLRDK